MKNNIMNNQTPKSSRINNLNAIRLFAAILVIYGHMHALLGFPINGFVGNSVSTLAVKIFFVISGYLLCESWMRDSNPIRYALRRYFRIMPGLILLVLISMFIVGPIFTTLSINNYITDPNLKLYLSNIFLYITYSLPGVFNTNIYPNAVNGSLWSLPVEVLMYILLPIIISIGKWLKSRKLSIIIFIIILIMANLIILIFYPNYRYVIYATNIKDIISLAPYFFIGSLYSFLDIKIILNIQIAFAALFALVMFEIPTYLCELLLYVVLPYCILTFGLATPPVFWRIGNKNDYSYGVYLYGFLVQQMYVSKFGSLLSINQSFIICACISFVFAFISWHTIEERSQIFGKKIIKLIKE
jgi:peptidoglycan/LPS O-acetylase OafA/YrhL